MKTCIFDIETSSLYADTGIMLCGVLKEYGAHGKIQIVRADEFSNWGTRRSDTRQCVKAFLKKLEDFDLYVAHNGQYFDKTMLTSWVLRFSAKQKPWLRFAKFVDPVMLARRHMRLSRRSLENLLQFLRIPEEKTRILWQCWMRATIDGDRRSLSYIVDHCVADVIALEKAYDKVKGLVKDINDRGSAF